MRKYIFALAILVFAFFPSAYAEEVKTPEATQTVQKGVLVAAVDVQDIQIIKQDGSAFTIAFNIFNSEGVQPKIVYAVNLLKKETKGYSLIHQKIYSGDVLSLGSNDSIHKEITYTAPEYLKGTYFLQVESKNPDGLIFGTVKTRELVTLNGTNEYIQIDRTKCFLTVDGEDGNKHYTLNQGVDISQKETLIAHCPITNTFKTSQIVVPAFQVYRRSSFGKLIKDEKQTPLTIKSNQKTDFVAKLPKVTEPQAYDVVLTFLSENGSSLSGSVAFHFVLRGESATIQNLTINKDYYRVGEIALLTFFWTGSADSFPGARVKSANTEQTISSVISIVDSKRNVCSEPVSKTLDIKKGGGLEHFSIPVVRDCQNPIILAKIIDASGKVLAENSYEFRSKNIPASATSTLPAKTQNGSLPYVAVSVFLLIFAISAVGMYVIKKNKQASMAVLFGMMIGAGLLSGGGEASAKTFTVEGYTFDGTYVWADYTVDLDRSSYSPGDIMETHMQAVYPECLNWIISIPGHSYLEEGGLFNSVTIDGTTITSQQDVSEFERWDYFTAPNSSGNALFAGTLKLPNYPKYWKDDWTLDGYSISSNSVSIPYTITSPFTFSLSSVPNPVSSGWNTNLTWSAPGAVFPCVASGGWSGNKATSGTSEPQPAIFADTTYTLECTDTLGNSSTQSVSVQTLNCTGVTPANAVINIGDDTGLVVNTPKKYGYPDNPSVKCEFHCNPGFAPNATFTACNAIPPIDGKCGPANGSSSVSKPVVGDLCSAGTPGPVTGDDAVRKWNWKCFGQYGGVDKSCSSHWKKFNFILF